MNGRLLPIYVLPHSSNMTPRLRFKIHKWPRSSPVMPIDLTIMVHTLILFYMLCKVSFFHYNISHPAQSQTACTKFQDEEGDFTDIIE